MLTGTFTTPSGGSFPENRHEIGLHTLGRGSSAVQPGQGQGPDIYFDDFAVRLEGGGGGGGFAPAVQELSAGE